MDDVVKSNLEALSSIVSSVKETEQSKSPVLLLEEAWRSLRGSSVDDMINVTLKR